jgi:type II secretory pathway pseudopilin PulG
LIELIIVIAIIAILAVSAFLILTKWIWKSRDGRRLSDLWVIRTSLEVYKTENNHYPIPDNNVEVISQTWDLVVWIKWIIWDKIASSSSLWKSPLDPSTNSWYYYAVSNDYKAYDLVVKLENWWKSLYLWNNALAQWDIYKVINW